MKTAKDVFHHMVEKTTPWIADLADTLSWKDDHRAYSVLRAVLHTLRDRMPVDEVAQFGAQLPSLLRGVYYEGWHPAGKPLRIRHKKDFLEAVWIQLNRPDDIDLEVAALAVFRLLANRISSAEMDDIAHCLPKEIRELMASEVPVAKK